ncbi:MFS transporter [Rhodococcus koreensis]|uniref:MFS transporter n=1 Tax=Rhodococcus koreensis TaxID=99653 RepID=UPI003670700A
MTTTPTPGVPDPTPASGNGSPSMRKVGLASLLGTTIEFYDFVIFGLAAALVFPTVFFPALGAAAGTVASFATLGVAFAARPLGSILFGHFGDRLGRKKTLVATLLLMGFATLVVGLVPSADYIGVAAPISIVLMRILQGVAAGGEWAGATLFSSEYAPKSSRAFWSNLPSVGGACGTSLASATYLAISLSMSTEAFLSWGWRIPFISSVVLVGFSLWVRLTIDETPVFRKEKSQSGVVRVPFAEALRNQPKAIFLASGMVVAIYAVHYSASAYLVSYATAILDLTRTQVLAVGIGSGMAMIAGQMVGVYFADRIGRRKIMLTAYGIETIWVLALFPIINVNTLWAFAIGVWGTLFINSVATGPLGAFLSETFETRYRYTAIGFCYNIAGVLGGAIPPLIAAGIIAAYGTTVYGLILAGIVLVSWACVWGLSETRHVDLDAPNSDLAATGRGSNDTAGTEVGRRT